MFTDDILCCSTDPMRILIFIDQHLLLKDGSIEVPKRYLGADVGKMRVPDDSSGKEYWYMGSAHYVKEAIRNVETWLDKKGRMLKTKAAGVFPSAWIPELDGTPLISDPDLINYYQQQIGVLRWIVELGRIDICTEVSMLAAFSAAPRVGHLEAAFHVFAYLKLHDRSRMLFDSSVPDLREDPKPDWHSYYGDLKEEMPPDMPASRGNFVRVVCFVDASHGCCKLTRRSRTGVLLYINRAPVAFYSKKQTSIETSSFGSEFSAMKTACEMIIGLRYKLRMMGIPVEGPAVVRCDNMSVVSNSSVPDSVLKKKSLSIAYHFTRECSARSIIQVYYEPSETNWADMLSKVQTGAVRLNLAKNVLW